MTSPSPSRVAGRFADLSPPLGFPGGPCHVMDRIRQEVRNPRLRDELIEDVEAGQKLDNAEASKIYEADTEAGVGRFQQILITSHAQYRMDQRGMTVPEIRMALKSFQKQWMDYRSQKSSQARLWEEALMRAEPILWEDPKIGLTLVFQVHGKQVRLITTYWKGQRDPRPVDESTCHKVAAKVDARQIDQWRQDMRRMTKIYRSVPTDVAPALFQEAVQEAQGFWRTFQENLRDWIGNLTLPNMYLEGNLEPLYDLGTAALNELNVLFPPFRDRATGKYLPSPRMLKDQRPANIRRYQEKFQAFFAAAEALLQDEGGSVERAPVTEQFEVGPVSVHVTNLDRARNENAFRAFLKRVPIMLKQVQAAGFGAILRGLVLNVVFDPTTIAAGSAGRKTINIYPGGMGSSTTLIHEIGHWVHDRLLSRSAKTEWYDTLKEAQDSGTQEFITHYGATNPDEAFADAFRLYVGKGPRALGPRTLRFFEQLTKGSGAMRTSAQRVALRHRG